MVDPFLMLAQVEEPSSPVDPVGFLETFIDNLGSGSLDLVVWLLAQVGLEPADIPGGLLGVAFLGFLLFLPIALLLAWSVRRYILHRIRKDRNRTGPTVMVLSAALKPALLLLWIYAGLIGLSPLLARSVVYLGWDLLLPIARISCIVGTVGAFGWFAFGLISRWETRLQQWKPGEGETNADRPLLIPLVLRSARFCLPVAAALLAMNWMLETDSRFAMPPQFAGILVIAAVSWVFAQVIRSFPAFILRKYDLDASDNLDARKIYTQVKVIQRLGYVVLGIFSFSAVILLFPAIRQFGQALLASAGVAGIILGFALQQALGNLLAGIQIAFTQPIRIDDVVIVENEWGWIEDITLTYVVVKIWDWRRMVLPISYFIQKPFQNWTRTSASIIGTVFMKADYRLPVQKVREAVEKIVKQHRLWDGKVYCLQVTDCGDQTVELRVLVSAVDSPKAWDLRCDIRESMLTYVQEHFPECLPRIRISSHDHAARRDERLPIQQDNGRSHLDAEETAQSEQEPPRQGV